MNEYQYYQLVKIQDGKKYKVEKELMQDERRYVIVEAIKRNEIKFEKGQYAIRKYWKHWSGKITREIYDSIDVTDDGIYMNYQKIN